MTDDTTQTPAPRPSRFEPRFLVVSVTFGFLAALAYLLMYGLPSEHSEPLLVLLGSLTTGWTAILGYYFGSTAGSARKTDLIAEMEKKQ